MPTSDGGDDFIGVGDPFEGFGMEVVVIEESIDGGLRVSHRSEDAAFETSLAEGCEEAFDGVEPGSGGWREVEGPAWMASQPLAHRGMLVSRVIVEDRVDGLSGGDLTFDRVQKANE